MSPMNTDEAPPPAPPPPPPPPPPRPRPTDLLVRSRSSSLSVSRSDLNAASDPNSLGGQYLRSLSSRVLSSSSHHRAPSRLSSSVSSTLDHVREEDDGDEEEEEEEKEKDNKRDDEEGGNNDKKKVEDPDAVDRRRLHRALSEAGEDAIGVGAVEVWVLNDDGSYGENGDASSMGMLVRPPGGWWLSPELRRGGNDDAIDGKNEKNEDERKRGLALRSLDDPDCEGYVPAAPLPLGVDLAGVLWSEARGGGTNAFHLFSSPFGRRRSSAGDYVEDNDNVTQQGGSWGRTDLETGGKEVADQGDRSGKPDIEKGGKDLSEPVKLNRKETNVSNSTTDAWDDDEDPPASSSLPALPHFGSSGSVSKLFRGSSRDVVNRLSKSHDPRMKLHMPTFHLPHLHHSNGQDSHRQATAPEGSPRLRRGSGVHLRGGRNAHHNHHHHHHHHEEEAPALLFRDVQSLLLDPLTPKTARTGLLHRAGFVQAAGVPFESHGTCGIVLFLIHESETDEDEEEWDVANMNSSGRGYRAVGGGGPSSLANQLYLLRAADAVGLALSTVHARRACLALKIRQQRRNWKDAKGYEGQENGGGEHTMDPSTLKDGRGGSGDGSFLPCCEDVGRRIRVGARKCRGNGGQMQIPPAPTSNHALWTLCGCFLSLLLLSAVDVGVRQHSGGSIPSFLPPMGALVALQFGLTAAPASQPRNALYAQAVGGLLAVAFTYVPVHILPFWARRAIAPAVVIATNSRLGVIHPPAGAAAVLLSSLPGGAGGRGAECWALYGLLVMATAVSILPAMAVNNLSRTRQYPTYWKLLPTAGGLRFFGRA